MNESEKVEAIEGLIKEAMDAEEGVLLEFQIGTHYGRPKYVQLTKKGINNTTYDKHGIATITPTWGWSEFKVNRILINDKTGDHVEKYDFTYDGKEFREKEFKDMRDAVALTSCFDNKNRQVFGPVIYKYCVESKVPRIECKDTCGFTDIGWTLPPKYHVSFNKGIQQKFKQNIMKLNSIDCSKTLSKHKKLYEAIKVKNRDVILAYGMIAPFFHALLDHTHLNPFLALYSVKNTTGKSTMAELISKKTWNNYGLLTSNQLNSESRARDYMSSSTFPIVIDESEKLSDKIKDLLKGTATAQNTAEYKNMDQTLGMDKPLCTPQIYTFNTPPSLFLDTAYLSRGYMIEMDKVMTSEDEKRFTECIGYFKDGEMGALILQELKDLTVLELKETYDAQKGLANNLVIRQDVKAKLLQVGAALFEKVFDIKLDLSELPNCLAKSEHFGVDNVFDMVEVQLRESVHGTNTVLIKGVEVSSDAFSPRFNWIQSEIKRHVYKKEKGFVYTTNNLQDLKNRLRIEISGVPELREQLNRKWKVSEVKSFCVKGVSVKGMFIPEVKTRYKPIPMTEEEIEAQHPGRTKEERELDESFPEDFFN